MACGCANKDWTNVDQTRTHHPDCDYAERQARSARTNGSYSMAATAIRTTTGTQRAFGASTVIGIDQATGTVTFDDASVLTDEGNARTVALAYLRDLVTDSDNDMETRIGAAQLILENTE